MGAPCGWGTYWTFALVAAKFYVESSMRFLNWCDGSFECVFVVTEVALNSWFLVHLSLVVVVHLVYMVNAIKFKHKNHSDLGNVKS